MANRDPKMGIKCRNMPDLFAPITEIPFIQNKKANNPGKKITYVKVK